MTNINKINNDFESTKIQKNMTNTQKKNLNITKEGKIVNAFYKDPQLSLDETLDTLVISHTEVSMPQKLFEKTWKVIYKDYYDISMSQSPTYPCIMEPIEEPTTTSRMGLCSTSLKKPAQSFKLTPHKW